MAHGVSDLPNDVVCLQCAFCLHKLVTNRGSSPSSLLFFSMSDLIAVRTIHLYSPCSMRAERKDKLPIADKEQQGGLPGAIDGRADKP